MYTSINKNSIPLTYTLLTSINSTTIPFPSLTACINIRYGGQTFGGTFKRHFRHGLFWHRQNSMAFSAPPAPPTLKACCFPTLSLAAWHVPLCIGELPCFWHGKDVEEDTTLRLCLLHARHLFITALHTHCFLVPVLCSRTHTAHLPATFSLPTLHGLSSPTYSLSILHVFCLPYGRIYSVFLPPPVTGWGQDLCRLSPSILFSLPVSPRRRRKGHYRQWTTKTFCNIYSFRTVLK